MKKLLLYFDTIRHLRVEQVLFQVAYRLSKVRPLTFYAAGADVSKINFLSFSDHLSSAQSANEKGCFWFLNQKVQFGDKIYWAYSANGKLWNYNLQYGNYLLQEDISLHTRLNWLRDLHQCLGTNLVSLEPYPVSIRVINTIRLLCRHKLQEKDLLTALHAELGFLAGRVEYHLLANHVLENAFALMMGGAFFRQPDWLSSGQKILMRELNEQVLKDGAHYELSPMYHQIILYRVLELVEWYQEYEGREDDFLGFVTTKACLMLGWLKNITFSNNDIPHLNDSAPFVAFDTQSLLHYASYLQLNTALTLPLSDSGYRMFRQANYECIVDAAPIGPSYQAGHGHADALSFILYYKSSPVFVEVGTSTYGAGARREYERSTAAHNTVVVNGVNQSEVWDSFRVGKRATVSICNDEAREFEAEHDGYMTTYGIMHKRKFSFNSFGITITDKIKGRDLADSVAFFHLHPSMRFEIEGGRVYLGGIGVVEFANPLRLEVSDYQFAEGFNLYSPAKVLEVAFENELKTSIKFF